MIIPNETKRKEIVDLLIQAYWMEVETVASYIANSINPDGVRAKEIKNSLAADITAELGHAQLFGKRIKELYGRVPGSMEIRPNQKSLQPAEDPTDIVHVIKGVIEAEQGAINHYRKIIETCEGTDYVTADMVTTILADEEGHLREFEGFLKEYEKGGR
ncbi:ferritin-like domain-containing protein [Humisphaera borealis]|uniref:Rubrerythrin n=1 Tax=Humisphaera borealis TaxID=2807512 RepID=A0A7M2WYJ4_9BACT|nr:ferritin-like domain-containing protein [Humisphaera borealis]QOV89600.1 rubrerythrin [Humisphaera borealis]